jgi:hypothetical protein
MRYAALVSYCDISDFGPHRLLTDVQEDSYHLPDEALVRVGGLHRFAGGDPNSKRFDEKAVCGKNDFRPPSVTATHRVIHKRKLTVPRLHAVA